MTIEATTAQYVPLEWLRAAEVREQQWRLLATTDPLTGLGNRRELEEAHRLCRDVQVGVTVAWLVLLDLDRFKQINDEHGHAAGDVVLSEVARRLHDAVGETGVVTRIGGDEFAVLLDAAGERDGYEVARDLTLATTGAPVELADGTRLDVQVSAGVALVDPHEDLEVALAAADAQMYAVKRRGRPRVGRRRYRDGEAA